MQFVKKLFIVITVLTCSINAYAQKWGSDPAPEPTPKDGPRKPVHPKKTFQDNDDKIYWQVSLPVYLNISTSADSKGEQYRMKNIKTPSMESHSNPMYFDGHGEHYIRHQDYEHGIPEKEVAFKVYVDGLSPATKVRYLGAPQYEKQGTIFFGKGLTAELNSTDQMSGLDQILHSVNEADYVVYDKPSSFSEEKSYTYMYYAVDLVGNSEVEHMDNFTVDLSSPESSHELTGKRLDLILSSRVNIALSSNDELSGVKQILWKMEGQDFQTYSKKLSIANMKDGEHTLLYKAIDQVENEETARKLEFYLDKIAPVVTAEIEGDLYRNDGKAYISERSLIKLAATDNKAGVQAIFYSIDGKAEKTYGDPFHLDAVQGPHKIKFKGLDKVDNMGLLGTNDDLGNLFLDVMPPAIDHEYEGPKFFTRDTIFITSETRIRLSATDYQAGIKTLNYLLDETEKGFDAPFTVENEGYHDVEYYAIDNVNNRKDDQFFFMVDNQGPEIFHHFSMQAIGAAKLDDAGDDEVPIYSTHNLLYLAATDNAVGTNMIFYTLDDGTEKLYSGPIRNLRKGFHFMTIRATDHLGNETKSEIIQFMIK